MNICISLKPLCYVSSLHFKIEVNDLSDAEGVCSWDQGTTIDNILRDHGEDGSAGIKSNALIFQKMTRS